MSSSVIEREVGGKREMTEGLAAQILHHIRTTELVPGTHVTAQDLALRFNVSRFPVGQALQLLAVKGVLTHERNRGYFVSDAETASAEALGLSNRDETSDVYFKVADDHLHGRLPDPVSEAHLRELYGVTKSQLVAVLNRIAQEGWAERRPGYGWSFSPMLSTPESLEQTYRVRLALEPAALMEPTYHLDPETAARCRAAESRLLAGAIETDSADMLHERGVRFHEAIIGASGNPFSWRRSDKSTVFVASSRIVPWSTGSATANNVRNTSRSSISSSARKMKKPRRRCAATWSTLSRTCRRSGQFSNIDRSQFSSPLGTHGWRRSRLVGSSRHVVRRVFTW